MSIGQSLASVREQVSEQEWQARLDLAAAYRLVAYYGWDDLIFTHLSARVPGLEHHSTKCCHRRAGSSTRLARIASETGSHRSFLLRIDLGFQIADLKSQISNLRY